MEKHKLYINGQWVEAMEYQELRSPYNQEVVAYIPSADKYQIEQAIDSAQKATKVMRSLSAAERSEILEKVSDILNERKEECALILAT